MSLRKKEYELFYAVLAGLGTYNQWRSVLAAMAVCVAIFVLIILFQAGYIERWLTAVPWRVLVYRIWGLLRPKVEQSGSVPVGHIPLAQDREQQRWIFADVAKLESVGIFAKRGGGKSALVDSILYELIRRFEPAGQGGVQLVILDPKRVDYTLYNRLPHLALPIAQRKEEFSRALKWAIGEMDRRAEFFNTFTGRKCNDIDRYHALRNEYGRFELPTFPYLFVLVEEAGEVTNSKADEEALETLIKVGRAFGVNIWPITQRNTASSLTNEVQSQLSTRFVGYMAGAETDLKRIGLGDIPDQVIAGMVQKPGYFALDYLGEWHQVYVPLVSDRDLETAVAAVSLPEPPTWPQTEAEKRPKLRGSKQQKERMVKQWFVTLDKKPTLQQFRDHFGCGKDAASKWINELWI